MESLPPIPTPPAQRWREFRIQVLPLVIFLITLVAIALMWRNFVQPSGVIGHVEAVQANVISLNDGVITDLAVERFQTVTNGQVLGQVQVTDPEMLQASVGSVQADLKVLRAQMRLDEMRNSQDIQRLQLDLQTDQVALQTAKAHLTTASNTFWRSQVLVNDGVESSLVLDINRAAKEALEEEIRVRTISIANRLEAIKKSDAQQQVSSDPVIQEALQAKQAELEQTLKPTQLRAPMDGVVSIVYHRLNERVVRGEPILTISATKAERVVGYLRQPVYSIPNLGDTVIVRTRTQKRQVGTGEILKIGAQFELVNPALLSTDSNRVEMGLPILVSLPPGLTVAPGEFVDLAIRPASKTAKVF
jgi:multidrug resistance efflux pump